MFITEAFAQGAGGGAPGGILNSLLLFVPLIAIMYFLIWRPQQKMRKQHQEMISSLRRGDVVVTAGGIIGKITKVTDDTDVQVEISDGVKVMVSRNLITDVRSKTEPAKDKAK